MDTKADVVRIELRAYLDDDPDLSYYEQYSESSGLAEEIRYARQDRERLKAYHDGDWYCVGMQCRAIVRVLNAEFCVDESSVWGFESDNDASGHVWNWAEIYYDVRCQLLERGFTAQELNTVPVVVESTPEHYDGTYYA